VFALVALLAVPGRASATVLTYVPGGSTGVNDLGDLDHHYYYAWTLGMISVPTGETITSAYVTFTNLYNWDSNKNVLWMDMYGAPVNASGGSALVPLTGGVSNPGGDSYTTTVRYAQDVALGQVPVTDMVDAFASANPLTTGTPTHLTEHSFLPDSGNPLTGGDISALQTVLQTPQANFNPTTLPASYASVNTSGTTGWVVSAGAAPGMYDYRYYFTTGAGSQLEALKAYIGPSNDPDRDVTLAFDPDCHFFNDGVSFTLVTGSTGGAAAVPEPASLMLLGTGLLLTAQQYRRRRAKKAAK
jgi:hypothetical protein